MAQVLLFEDPQFHGEHKHVFVAQPNFAQRVSSLVVLEGNWAFYADNNLQTQYPPILGPGLYLNLPAGIEKISSLQPVGAAPTVSGDPVDSHVILFEHAKFHGGHKHVFTRDPNLNADHDQYNFNDKVSSFVVLQGNWAFYADWNFENQYPPIVGPGLYPNLPAGIKNDDMSSLQLVNAAPTVIGAPVDSHVILFIDAIFLAHISMSSTPRTT
jgi:hypothetical protein